MKTRNESVSEFAQKVANKFISGSTCPMDYFMEEMKKASLSFERSDTFIEDVAAEATIIARKSYGKSK